MKDKKIKRLKNRIYRVFVHSVDEIDGTFVARLKSIEDGIALTDKVMEILYDEGLLKGNEPQ